MRVRCFGVLATAGLLAVSAAACGSSAGENGDGGKVRVAASISVLEDMTEEVGGDRGWRSRL